MVNYDLASDLAYDKSEIENYKMLNKFYQVEDSTSNIMRMDIRKIICSDKYQGKLKNENSKCDENDVGSNIISHVIPFEITTCENFGYSNGVCEKVIEERVAVVPKNQQSSNFIYLHKNQIALISDSMESFCLNGVGVSADSTKTKISSYLYRKFGLLKKCHEKLGLGISDGLFIKYPALNRVSVNTSCWEYTFSEIDSANPKMDSDVLCVE